MALAALSVFFAAVDEGEVVSASLRKTAETKKKLTRAKIQGEAEIKRPEVLLRYRKRAE